MHPGARDDRGTDADRGSDARPPSQEPERRRLQTGNRFAGAQSSLVRRSRESSVAAASRFGRRLRLVPASRLPLPPFSSHSLTRSAPVKLLIHLQLLSHPLVCFPPLALSSFAVCCCRGTRMSLCFCVRVTTTISCVPRRSLTRGWAINATRTCVTADSASPCTPGVLAIDVRGTLMAR